MLNQGTNRYGKLLMAKYKGYKYAELEVGEMIVTIEGCWIKTEIQLEYVRKIWERLDPRLQAHVHEVLQVLQNKLQAALVKVDSVLCSKDGEIYTVDSRSHQLPVKKIKAALLKSGIKQAIQDLGSWRARFTPSWRIRQSISTWNRGRLAIMTLPRN